MHTKDNKLQMLIIEYVASLQNDDKEISIQTRQL